METDRPDAIFRDPFARRLAGERGEAIVNGMKHGRSMAWPMIVRTAVLDELITRCLAQDGVDCVLNLAAGLDARPWRMNLRPTLTWIDVDHPVMIDLKTTELRAEQPRCRYEAVGLDLADGPTRRALFTRVASAAKRVLVISEGLLVYLPGDAVAELATDLRAQPNFALWLVDLASPALLKMLARNWGPVVAAGNAPFRFGPADAPAFFSALGWREEEFRSMFQEGIRLKRTMKLGWLWAALGKLAPNKKQKEMKRFSGVSLLQRA
jgi:methyltransferase (TIGR00027 family)